MLNKATYCLLILIAFFHLKEANASHVMGGQITWECQANGQYVFTLKVYRDCNGINLPTNNQIIEIHNYPNVGLKTDLPVNFINSEDISPPCLGAPCGGAGGVGAIEEFVFRSNPINLNGVPPANGWTFTWTNYARNGAVDNIANANTYGLTLRAKMFPYQAQNANPCFDSSPDFFQEPSTVVCSDQPFTYNHSAYDNELDSLVYSWGRPLNGPNCTNPPCRIPGIFQDNTNPNFVPYDGTQGYSFNSPYPGPTINPQNVPATLDPNTGEISFESYTAGEFVSVVRVQGYKCGQLVSEVYRDLQTVVQSGCGLNKAPIIPPVFANGTFSDTVKVGEYVSFDINVFDTLRTGNSSNDSIFIFATGQQFGANFTDSTTGCTNPPCATFSSPLPDSSFASYNTTFKWQTGCEHIAQNDPNCTSAQNTYLFVIRTNDGFCPASGLTVATVSITVLADTLVPHPNIHCADVQNNGDVIIDWNQTEDPDSSFKQWMIYSSTNINGPYVLIDSIADYNITNYTHNNAGANDQSIHYIVRAKSGCHRDWLSLATDTISSMYIDPTFNGNCVNVSWNPIDNPLPIGSSSNYDVYREYPIGSGFSLYKTTANTFFCDTFNVCADTVSYRIQMANSGNGCSGSSSNINGVRFQYALPNIDAGANVELCNGQSAQIGGSPTSDPWVSYQWSPSSDMDNDTLANPTVSPSDTVMYYLTVTDSLSCFSEDSVLINVQPTPEANAGVDTFSCRQNFPFQLYGNVSVSNTGRWIGGNGTYTPDRNTLNATYQPTIAEINAGFVQLELISTNVGICDPDTDQITIQIPSFESNLNTGVTDVSCNGFSDGAAGISANGSNAPYTFSWDTGSGIVQGDTITGLAVGTYTVTASNRFGCDSILSVTISEPAALNVNTSVDFNVSCKGLNNGIAYATPSGGTTPYTYLWSDNQTQDTARNLIAGNYSVTLTDNNGCSATASVSITEPDTLISSIGSSFDVSCNGGNDGYAVVEGTGGTAPYTYLWSDNQVQDTAQNLSAGNYRVTITDSLGCTDTVSVTINEPAPLLTSISSSTNVSCNGLSDGSATISASGGTAAYTYLWSNNQTTATATNLAAGNYSVTVTDANACTSVENVSITEPNTLSATINNQTNVSCNGLSDGSAKVSVSGGTQAYTYLWSDNQTADSAINLSAGNYAVTVTDSNGCSAVANVVISEPSPLTINTQLINNLSCYQANDGAAFVTTNGGTTPYTYNWSNNSTNDSITFLAAGTYLVTVTDAQSCTAVDSIQITQPDSLQSSISDTAYVSCNGGNDGYAEVSAQGGTMPYTYNWSDNQTTKRATNLSQGTYQVTLTDANGCSSISTIIITEPNILTANIDSTNDVSCNGFSDGRAVVTANGGTLPYTYLWSNNQQSDTASNLSAGNYSVTITDSEGCSLTANTNINEPTQLAVTKVNSSNVSCHGGNDGQASVSVNGGTLPYTYLWSNNQTTATASNLSEGTYTVTIIDSLGCSINDTIDINEPPLLTATISSVSNVSCNGAADGTATVTANGGTQPYTYNWSNSETTASIQNLSPGTYRVTITDDNACTTIDSVSITQPNVLSSTISNSTNVSCFGLSDGSASVSMNGGTAPYTYFWSTNGTSNTIQNLSAGTYRLTVTDNNNCRITDSVVISQPNPLNSTISGQDISCFGRNDGTATVSVTGGSAPYLFDWSNNSSNATIGNLFEGSYTVTITDINGCEDTNSYLIEEPNELQLDLTADDTICINVPKQVVAMAQGGTGAYTYTWSDNLGNNPIQNLSPQQTTTFSVSVTDANNCPQKFKELTLTVRDIASTNLAVNSSNDICLGDSSTISVDFDGDLGPYFYTWNQALNGIGDQRVSPNSSTNYQLTITDICNNNISDDAWVEVNLPPEINLNDTLIEGCEDLTVRFSNQTPSNYSYVWDFGNGQTSTAANPTFVYTEAGFYEVGLRVTSPEGCESISNADVDVRVKNSPLAEIFATPTLTDIENPVIDLNGDFTDANSWIWYFGDGNDSSNVNNFSYRYADTGSYRLELIERNAVGCADTANLTIRINPNFDIQIPNVFIPNTGGSNGGRYNPNQPDNSVFFPFMEYVEEYHLMIFNRWGELVFESKDINIGWDGYYKGQLAQSDVYVYKIEATFINGQEVVKTGDVTLLR